jgi:glycosyltransferase involved in cell wall biosynthesis
LGGGSDQIVTVYDLIPLREEGLLRSMRPDHRWAYGRYLRQIKSAQRVIAISRTTADDVVGRLGVSPDRVDVVYPVVAAPGRRERQPSHDPIFLLLGALDPHKRPELAVRALARFRDRHGAGHLRVIGPAYGEQLEPVRREINRLGVGAHVTCEGRVGDLELEAAFATATALITTSRIEGFGLPPVEALIRGVPVIAVETDAARETIGGYARLVSDEPEAIADAMGQLEPVDVAVSERLAARFSTAAATRALHGIYAKVLD